MYYRTLCSSIKPQAFRKGIRSAVSLLEAETSFAANALSEALQKSGLEILHKGFSPSTDTFFCFDWDMKNLDPEKLNVLCPDGYHPTLSVRGLHDARWVAVEIAEPYQPKYRFCVNGSFEQQYLADIAGDLLLFHQLERARTQTFAKIVRRTRKEKALLREFTHRYGGRSFRKNLVSTDTLTDRRRVALILNRTMLRRVTILELEELSDKVARRRNYWQELQIGEMLDIAGISEEFTEFERSVRGANALATAVTDYASSVKDILDSRSNEVLYFWTIAASVATILAILGLLR